MQTEQASGEMYKSSLRYGVCSLQPAACGMRMVFDQAGSEEKSIIMALGEKPRFSLAR